MTGSQQIAWYETHLFKERVTRCVGERPTAGTPDWCALDDWDPCKEAALMDAGVLWCLGIDTRQEALAAAATEIAKAADWSKVAQEFLTLESFYGDKPWLRRVTP